MTTSTWYGVGDQAAQARLVAAWPDVPVENLETLAFLLSTARAQVIAAAPAPLTGENIETDPLDRYVLAQLQQTINLWNAGRVTQDGTLGDGGYVFTPRPLDKTIRGMIRPPIGRPRAF